MSRSAVDRWRRIGLSLTLLLAGGVLLLVGVSKAEEQDPFCISCHTLPEEVYYERAQQVHNNPNVQVIDLASGHYAEQRTFRCIDCHRGESNLEDRISTLALGAGDAIVFISGQADPAIEKAQAARPDLLNRACSQCHTETLLTPGFNSHFHNQLAAAYEIQLKSGASPLEQSDFGWSVTCLDCHRAHVQSYSGAAANFLDLEGVVYLACVQCHQELGHGPLDLSP